MPDKIDVENINTPGVTTRVNSDKYAAMRGAMLRVMPHDSPGETAKDIKNAALPYLPEVLFPDGATAGWWQKCVQLDLEAKGIVARSTTKPLRFFLT